MATLRSTVIMKTDISQFTQRVKNLSQSELSSLLNQHKNFISNISVKNEGSVIKGEGDAFWIIFSSVTSAALAAVEMQQELRTMQSGKADDERLAIHVAIALGDVLHQDTDIFGDTVNLTARIESVTPPDEIYLSQAAWLALNKAEIQTSFVNEFSLKGMSEPEKIYKIDQKHKTRIIKNQVIIFTDLRGFTAYHESHSIEDVERLLTQLDLLEKEVCEEYGGTIRLITADAYFLTFIEAHLALAAIESLCRKWSEFIQQHQIGCGIRIGVNKGDLNIFRSCIYGRDINIAARLETTGRIICPGTEQNSVLVTERIKDEVSGTSWSDKLQKVDKRVILDQISDYRPKDFFRENDVYQLIVE
jgi:class 3 adenylate cyclase